MKAKKVSVIMRCKNSDWVIGQALSALFSQTFQGFDLLVVDSGSTDNTLNIIKQFPCRLVQIEPGSYYPGRVLNDAVKRCEAEVIVFLNSDSVMLSPHSLQNLLDGLKQDVAAVFGRQLPRPEAETWVKRDYETAFPEAGKAPDWMTMSFPLAAIRKSLLEKHPFYDDAWASEDTEWGQWARNQGYTVNYVPSAITMHSHNYTLKEIYGRRYVEGEADAFIYDHRQSKAKTLFNMLASFARDTLSHLKAGDLRGLLMIIPRRAVYHWAYLKGNQLGTTRKHNQDTDCGAGQAVVLSSVAR